MLITTLANGQNFDQCCEGAGINGSGPELVTWGDFECFNVGTDRASFEAACGSAVPISVDPGFGVQPGPCVGDNNFAVIDPTVTTDCYGGDSDFSDGPNTGNRALFVNGGDAEEIFCFDLSTDACTKYCFSGDLYTDCCNGNIPSSVGFSADGMDLVTPVTVFPSQSTENGWETYSAIFEGTGGVMTLCVIDGEPAGTGNDWALDNISTYALPQVDNSFTIANTEYCASTPVDLALMLDNPPAFGCEAIRWYERNGLPGVTNNSGSDTGSFISSAPGTYEICVDVGVGSCLRSNCQVITVAEPPQGAADPVRICSGVTTMLDLDSYITNGVSSTFSWSSVSEPNITGSAGSGTGNMITETLFNSSIASETVTYSVTPTSVADNCVGDAFDVVVTVLSGGSGPDKDNDGVVDEIDIDDDNDGIEDCVEKGLDNADLNDLFNITGTATVFDPQTVTLTDETNGQAGSVMSNNVISFQEDFIFSLEINLGSMDNGADGIAIVFHNDPAGSNALGLSGLGLGASGIQNGLYVEFDTYNNGTANGDIVNDHSQIIDSDAGTALTPTFDLGDIEDGAWHDIVFTWDASTSTLSVAFDNMLLFTFSDDLPNNYFNGTTEAFFGFSASTGGANNEQVIRFGDFCDFPIFVDTDGDGIPNELDQDSDNDGIPDAVEACSNISLTLEDCSLDSDANATYEMDSNGCSTGLVADAACDPLADSDGDGTPDYLETDSDNDGCNDSQEAGNAEVPGVDTPGVVNTCGLLLQNGIPYCAVPTTVDWTDENIAAPIGQDSNETPICSGLAFDFDPQNNIINSIAATFTWTAIYDPGLAGGANTGTSNITATLVNNTTAQLTATYTVVPTSTSGCEGMPFDIVVTILPVPIGQDQTPVPICSNEGFDFNPQNYITNSVASTFTWVATYDAGLAGGANTGTGNVTETLTNLTNTALNAVYTVTPTASAGGCAGTDFSISITVNPEPVGTNATEEPICSDTSFDFAPQDYVTNGVASTFTWTANYDAGLTGGENTGTGNIAETLTNLTGSTLNATYNIIPTSVDGCIGNAYELVISINPEPTAPANNDEGSICSGLNFEFNTQNYITNGVTSTFTWTATYDAGLTGGAITGAGNIVENLTNLNNGNATAVYTVTPTSTDGCIGTPFQITVTIDGEPVGANATEGPVCSNTSFDFDPQNYITNNVASTFNWIAVYDTGLTGGAGAGTSNLAETLTNLTSSTLNATYTLTPTSTDGCAGDPYQIVVSINPEPVGTTTAAGTVCSGLPFDLNPQDYISNSVASTFTWTAIYDAGVIGGTTTGTGNIAETLTNLTGTAADAVYTIIPTSTNACVGTAFTVTVTLGGEPVGAATTESPICSAVSYDFNPQNYITNGVASTFTWTAIYDTGLTGGVTTGTGNITATLTNLTGGALNA
ncbi:MAG: PKD-like domain-containing protein, partial [Bacteroidota bacterium]